MADRLKGNDRIRQNASRLTPAQQRAVLLLAAGRRVCEVAEAVGVDRTTLWRWREIPAFQAAEGRARAEAWDAGINRLRELLLDAVEVLARRLADGDPNVAIFVVRTVASLKPNGPVSEGEAERKAAEQAWLDKTWADLGTGD